MSPNRLTPAPQLALEAFLLDGQSRNLSLRTLKYYREQLVWFFEYLPEVTSDSLAQITPHTIRSYLVHLEGKGWSPASRHAAARAIRAFMNYCVNDGWLERSPMDRVRMPRVAANTLPAFDAQQVKELVDCASTQRDKAIILCLLDSGCRASEFLAWDVGDINIRTGTVRVVKTKNRRRRTAYLGRHARKELLKLYGTQSIEPDKPVWRSMNTQARLGIAGLQIMLRKLGEQAGVLPCSPHRFRRTFALWSLRNGMDIFTLQRLMGHSDISVLSRYLALVEDDLERSHERFGAVDNFLFTAS